MSLLFKFRPLVINPELANRIGLNEAIVLQQLSYWITETNSGVEHSGARWIYNTYEQWYEQFPFWSVETVKRTFTSLVKIGVVKSEKLLRTQRDHTNFYTVDYSHPVLSDEVKLTSSNGSVATLAEQVKLTSSNRSKQPPSIRSNCPVLLTEITTKNTTDIKNTLVPSDDGTPAQPKKGDYPTEFEKLWAEYPKREGSNPKNKAYQAWNARRKAGVTSEAMSAGLQRYVAFCGAKGQVGTSYVMQASRFFGPGLEFNNAWTVSCQPAQSGVKRHSDTAADLEGRSYETRIGWKNNTQEGRQ